jgi:hypothetical protein
VKGLKLIKLKDMRYLNASGTVTSCVVRIIVVLSNCVLRIIFETKEREAERYVTKIAS